MHHSVELHFPRLHHWEGEHHRDGELFTLYSMDMFHMRGQLLKIREEVDKRIADVEYNMNYIKKTWNPDDEVVS